MDKIKRVYSKSDDYILYIIEHQKSLKSALKTSFSVHKTIWICVGRKRILNGYCVVENQMLNVDIQDLWSNIGLKLLK